MTAETLTEDGGQLPLIGGRVTQCCFDYGTTLLFGREREHHRLRLQTAFSVRVGGQAHEVEPEDHSTVAIVLSLFNLDVSSAQCFGSGALSIGFTSGELLAVEPDPNFEAWTLHGPHGFLVVATPGGGLAIWDAAER